MKRRTGICLAIPLMASLCMHPPGLNADETPGVRKEKIRMILRTQDLRTPHDSALREFLYDRDTVVRERAVLACGSIQDTTLLQDLLTNLTDGPLPVQSAAAFAIGQTAQFLSPGAIAGLEHDIVWVRLDQTGARERMIEELGKFGTEQALTDLILRFGTEPGRERPALLMGIARFAIRKVTTPGAVRFSLEALMKDGPDAWVAAYALQRIGGHAETYRETARLVHLSNHPDPLVRMNLAILFGKLTSDSTVVETLTDMAAFDADWRVRVNALKALGNFPARASMSKPLLLALRGDNISVAITALAAFGGLAPASGPQEMTDVIGEVTRMAENPERVYPWQVQLEAAKAIAGSRGERALEVLRVPDGPERLLRAGMIEALGATGAAAAVDEISAFLDSEDPLLVRASLEALHTIAVRNPANPGTRDRAHAADIQALSGGDMAVVTTAASHLGDSLYRSTYAVPFLLEALRNLRAPADIEPIQEICRTLARINDRSAIPALEDLLAGDDRAASLAAAGALTSITGEEYGARIPTDREPLHTDFDFAYLEALPDTIRVTIGTARGDIRVDLYRDAAPFTIMSILKLAEEEGFYRGLIFHRVVPNFVIQGGDPRGDGWGGPGYSLRSEFSPLTYSTGTVGIASAGKDTEGSQFFITHSPQPHLDGRYTIIGRVVSPMETVDGVQVGDRIFNVARTP